MVNYWKSKVLPTIKKVFSAGNGKKAAAAEAAKTFDESKEGIDKDFEDKKTELQPKVLEIYEACSVEIKTLVKKPTPSGLKKNADGVNKLLEELVKIEFPGSKSASELCTKFSPALASGPVTYIFEKVAIFLPAEEPAKVEEAAAAVEATSKDIAVEDLKKEEAAEKVEAASAAAAAETPAPAEPTAEPAAETAEKPAEPEATPEPAAAAAEPEKPAEPAAEEPAKAVEPAAEPAKAAEAAEEPAKA